MEGYRILKTMQASKAPVHVVVKSYAASMAATITALAPHSVCVPGTPRSCIIRHGGVSFGNPTQQKQQLDIMKEWDRRMREPIARKMGTTMEKFTAEMYKQNVDGDWEEFAEAAVKLRWIDNIVHEIRETGSSKSPRRRPRRSSSSPSAWPRSRTRRATASCACRGFSTPDAYFLYNRDGYYR